MEEAGRRAWVEGGGPRAALVVPLAPRLSLVCERQELLLLCAREAVPWAFRVSSHFCACARHTLPAAPQRTSTTPEPTQTSEAFETGERTNRGRYELFIAEIE